MCASPASRCSPRLRSWPRFRSRPAAQHDFDGRSHRIYPPNSTCRPCAPCFKSTRCRSEIRMARPTCRCARNPTLRSSPSRASATIFAALARHWLRKNRAAASCLHEASPSPDRRRPLRGLRRTALEQLHLSDPAECHLRQRLTASPLGGAVRTGGAVAATAGRGFAHLNAWPRVTPRPITGPAGCRVFPHRPEVPGRPGGRAPSPTLGRRPKRGGGGADSTPGCAR